MEMTNRQIAENPSVPSDLTLGKCRTCGHLSGLRESHRRGARCSKCNRKGVSSYFPGSLKVELLRMIFYFYKNTYAREDDLKENLVSDIHEEVSKTLDHEEAIKLANDSRKMFDEFGDEQDCLERIYNFLRNRLSLDASMEVRKLNSKLLYYSDSANHIFEEHRGVVIITCILLETLLRDLLTNILVKNGIKVEEVKDICDDIRSFDKRKKEFKKLTGIPLKEAMNQCFDSNFYDNWVEVRKKRNDFLHKGEYRIITPATAEMAFNLAKNSFSVFANLHNRFCVKDINACNDDEPNAS